MASTSVLSLMSEALTASKDSAKQTLSQNHKAFIGWIHVSANDGATTVSAKLQHSPDGTNWIDLVSFTNIVNTTGFEAKQITSNVFINVRAVVTLAGTPSATVKVQFWYDEDK
jgi:hypothetical protein